MMLIRVKCCKRMLGVKNRIKMFVLRKFGFGGAKCSQIGRNLKMCIYENQMYKSLATENPLPHILACRQMCKGEKIRAIFFFFSNLICERSVFSISMYFELFV